MKDKPLLPDQKNLPTQEYYMVRYLRSILKLSEANGKKQPIQILLHLLESMFVQTFLSPPLDLHHFNKLSNRAKLFPITPAKEKVYFRQDP